MNMKIKLAKKILLGIILLITGNGYAQISIDTSLVSDIDSINNYYFIKKSNIGISRK